MTLHTVSNKIYIAVQKYSKQLSVNEPYIVRKISIRSQEQCLTYRPHIFRINLFYKALSIYSTSVFVTFLETGAHFANEGEDVTNIRLKIK